MNFDSSMAQTSEFPMSSFKEWRAFILSDDKGKELTEDKGFDFSEKLGIYLE